MIEVVLIFLFAVTILVALYIHYHSVNQSNNRLFVEISNNNEKLYDLVNASNKDTIQQIEQMILEAELVRDDHTKFYHS